MREGWTDFWGGAHGSDCACFQAGVLWPASVWTVINCLWGDRMHKKELSHCSGTSLQVSQRHFSSDQGGPAGPDCPHCWPAPRPLLGERSCSTLGLSPAFTLGPLRPSGSTLSQRGAGVWTLLPLPSRVATGAASVKSPSLWAGPPALKDLRLAGSPLRA